MHPKHDFVWFFPDIYLFTLNGVCFETTRQNKMAAAVRLVLFIKITLDYSVVFYVAKSKDDISYLSLSVLFYTNNK